MIEKNYNISRKQKKIFIASTIFLFTNSLIIALLLYFGVSTKFNLTIDIAHSLLRIVASTIVYITLINYFKYYQLKYLKIFTIIYLITFIYTILDNFSRNQNINYLPDIYDGGLLMFSMALPNIIFIFLLIFTKNKQLNGFKSLKKYAYTVIITTLFFSVLGNLEMFIDDIWSDFKNPKILLTFIPYIFFIEFGVKFKTSDKKTTDNNSYN